MMLSAQSFEAVRFLLHLRDSSVAEAPAIGSETEAPDSYDAATSFAGRDNHYHIFCKIRPPQGSKEGTLLGSRRDIGFGALHGLPTAHGGYSHLNT
jgi:hypothetical protein